MLFVRSHWFAHNHHIIRALTSPAIRTHRYHRSRSTKAIPHSFTGNYSGQYCDISKIMEQHEERLKELEERFKSMVEEIDKLYLRKMQGDMHRCAATCCDNQSYSMERNQNCVENCSSTLENAQRYVQSEISRLQNRWSRCLMECNDRAKDKTGGQGSATAVSKDFEICARNCIDTQCDLTTTLGTSMKRVLASGKYNGYI